MPRPKIKQGEDKYDTTIEEEAEKKLVESPLSASVVDSSVKEEVVKELDSMVYEAVVDGERKRYPVTTGVPTAGRFFVFRTYELDGDSRIIISPRDWDASFGFSEGPILTKYGFGTGNTCNITLKLVDVMIDVATEDIVGVYLLLMSPRFAQITVNPRKITEEFTDDIKNDIKERVLTNEALMLKFQLDEAIKRAETYREAMMNANHNIVEMAEAFAAPVVEAAIAALDAPENMFDRYGRTRPWYEKYEEQLKMVILAVFLLGMFALGLSLIGLI